MRDYARLRHLLRLLSISTSDAARSVGISRSMFSMISTGSARPTAAVAARLAAYELHLARKAAPVVDDLARIVRVAEVASHA